MVLRVASSRVAWLANGAEEGFCNYLELMGGDKLSIVFLAMLPFAAGATSLTLTSSSSGDLTISQALAGAGATVADLTGNAYDDIVVTGNGRILFDTAISSYTGTIHISSGATAVVKAVDGLGSAGGKVYVADGGALIPDATGFAAGTFTFTKAEVHLAGTGPDGAGALVAAADASQRGGIWGTKIVLDGDALIANRGNQVLDFPKQSPSASVVNLDMNGHTLTIAPNHTYIPVRMVVDNPGHIVVTNANLSMNNVLRLNGTADNTFTVKDNGYLNFFDMNVSNQAPWTLVWNTQNKLRAQQSGGRWDGPVQLLKQLTVEANAENGNRYYDPKLELYGPVSGTKKISFSIDDPVHGAGHLYLYSTNSFTGGVDLGDNTYLHVMRDGAVPVAGAPIVLSNAFLDVQADFCTLPSVDCFCSGTCTIPSSGMLPGRIVGTFTKRGAGALGYEWPLGMDGIDLKAGALKLANAPAAWYAGVYEGNTNITPWWAEGANTMAVKFFDGSATITNSQQLTLRWTTAAASFDATGACTYDGWIYCPADEAGTWRFASCINVTGYLYIDGTSVVGRQGSTEIRFGNKAMTEGWHHFTYRIGRNTMKTGPNTSVTKAYEVNTEITATVGSGVLSDWAAARMGLAVCTDSEKAQAKTTDVADFAAFPSDPGDGSVLRLVQPGSAAEAALEAEFLANRTLGFLAAATNTMLDLCGAPLFVGSVTGFPTVVHTDIPAWLAGSTPNLTVTGSWTAPASGIAAGAAFTVTGGILTFAEGATMTVPDSLSLRDTQGGSLTVATATGGIAGMPALVFAEGDRRGILRKSQDGKSLQLIVASGMMMIFR